MHQISQFIQNPYFLGIFFPTLLFALPYILRILNIRWEYMIKRKSFVGVWYSSYQKLETRSWIDSKIKIDISGSRIRFRTISDTGNYNGDVAFVRSLNNTYLIGEYTPQDPSRNNNGVLMLTIEPEGHFMYGYFVGSYTSGTKLFSPWVICKTESAIHEAKLCLKKTTISKFPTL